MHFVRALHALIFTSSRGGWKDLISCRDLVAFGHKRGPLGHIQFCLPQNNFFYPNKKFSIPSPPKNRLLHYSQCFVIALPPPRPPPLLTSERPQLWLHDLLQTMGTCFLHWWCMDGTEDRCYSHLYIDDPDYQVIFCYHKKCKFCTCNHVVGSDLNITIGDNWANVGGQFSIPLPDIHTIRFPPLKFKYILVILQQYIFSCFENPL